MKHQESSKSDSSVSETLDDSLNGLDEEQDVEILREEREEFCDSAADIPYGLSDRLLDDSDSVSEVKGYEYKEICLKCDRCEVIFEDKSDLREHVNRYHEVIKQCRFCPFKASLAEVLAHMQRNCEDEDTKEIEQNVVKEALDEEVEDDEFEESGKSYNLILVKFVKKLE